MYFYSIFKQIPPFLTTNTRRHEVKEFKFTGVYTQKSDSISNFSLCLSALVVPFSTLPTRDLTMPLPRQSEEDEHNNRQDLQIHLYMLYPPDNRKLHEQQTTHHS